MAAYITGWLMEKTKSVDIQISVSLSSVVGGIIILYIPGLIGMMINAGMSLNAALVAVSVYLPGDVLKVILATIVTSAIFKARPNSILARN
jgi:biotin transport system substrate-specific component